MKRINKKGFTLIELLAVIIILGVLLLIAVPSVSKYIQQSREKTYATNLSKLVDAVSSEVNSYTEPYTFSTEEYLVVPIVCLNLERGSSEKSPFAAYEPLSSYVVVTRNANNGFEYKVTALDQTGFGAKLAEPDAVKIETGVTPVKIKADGTEFTLDGTLDGISGTPKVITPGSTCAGKLK